MNTQTPLFIAVEGPIGVGKTSLAHCLAQHYSAHSLQEVVYGHPFLDKFYEDQDRWAFQTEMFFLTNRYEQLKEIRQHYLAQNLPVVSDYHLFKCLIFGNMTLKEEPLKKFNQVYNILNEDLPEPNVIVVLKASLETILTRIKKRNRHFEQDIDVDYLRNLMLAYEAYTLRLKEESTIPVIEIDGDVVDFVLHPEQLEDIYLQINKVIHKERD